MKEKKKSNKKYVARAGFVSQACSFDILCVITIIFVQIVICDYCRPAVVSTWLFEPLLSQLTRCHLAACLGLSSTVKM